MEAMDQNSEMDQNYGRGHGDLEMVVRVKKQEYTSRSGRLDAEDLGDALGLLLSPSRFPRYLRAPSFLSIRWRLTCFPAMTFPSPPPSVSPLRASASEPPTTIATIASNLHKYNNIHY